MLIAFATIALWGCCTTAPVPESIEDIEFCNAACAWMAKMGCEEGQPLPDGTSCADFCRQTQESGHWINPRCLATTTGCEQINDCGAPPDAGE